MHPWSTPTAAGAHRGTVAAGRDSLAARLDADDPHAAVCDERMEEADRVRSAADARDQDVGEPAQHAAALAPRLLPDHGVEIAHHHRIRMRPSAEPRR
jgi:hypothetical protein